MPSASAIHRQWNFALPIVSLCVNRNGDRIAATLGDGSFRFLEANERAEQPQELKVHNGVSLSLQPDADGHAFLSGGDDGKLFILDPALDAPTLLAEHKGKWIDHVAASDEGFRAYASGKEVHLLDAEGEKSAPLMLESSAGGLGFSPNGKRLAATHYNGASLWWTNAKDTTPVKLAWKGSHLGLLWHPEGKILITTMQENALHGWHLPDNKEMQMQGYAAKIHSLAFTVKGKYLATSGASQVICWPFFGGGPWGKTPLMLGSADGGQLVTRVAPHPKDALVAAGYDNGAIILAPLDGRMEMLIHSPKGSAVSGLVWNGAGDCLFAALESGTVLLFTIESVKRSVSHV